MPATAGPLTLRDVSTNFLDDARALVRLFYEAWVGGDTIAAEDLLAEGFRLHLAGVGEALDRSSLGDLGTTLFGPLGGVRQIIEDEVVEGDTVATRLTFVGVQDNGQPVEFAAMTMHRVVDGAIAEQWAVFERDALASVAAHTSNRDHEEGATR